MHHLQYKVVIFVYFWNSKPVIYKSHALKEKDCLGVLYLQCLAGVHFNPLRSSVGFVAPDMEAWNDEPAKQYDSNETGLARVSHVTAVDGQGQCPKCPSSEHL